MLASSLAGTHSGHGTSEPELGHAEPEGGHAEPELGTPEVGSPEVGPAITAFMNNMMNGTAPEPTDSGSKSGHEMMGFDGMGFAEGPEWEESMKAWGKWWEFHYIFTMVLFALLSVYCFGAVVYYAQRANRCRLYYVTLNILMVIVGVTRVVHFAIDPYNKDCRFNPIVNNVLFNISLPCISAAFYLLFTAMVKVTRVKLLKPGIFSKRMIVAVTAFHVVVAVTLDVTTGLSLLLPVYIIICQFIFVAWSLALCAMFLYLARRMHQCAARRQNALVTVCSNSGARTMMGQEPGISSNTLTTPYTVRSTTVRSLNNPKPELSRTLSTIHTTRSPEITFALRLMIATVALFLIMAGLQVFLMYEAVTVMLEGEEGVPLGPWAWWSLALAGRIIEFCLCATIALAATRGMQVKVSRSFTKRVHRGYSTKSISLSSTNTESI